MEILEKNDLTIRRRPRAYRETGSALKNLQFWLRSRKTRILTTVIQLVFRGLKFESDKEIGQKGTFFKALPGFTLIEIMMFIILVGIVMAPIMGPFVTSVLQSDRPEIVVSAGFLAAERLEQLQPAAYGSIVDEASASLTGNYSAFSRQVAVTLVDVNLANSVTDVGYKKVVVTVYHSRLPAAGISVASVFTY
ncbi:MAG: hypothetical protein A2Y79_02910 [Deltaproteobacteria bacterium RBG_13_43_22]|jgi:type II secretory pathway pseudopilin PulG|nr:MAG: hypothetical protein A2Y79_02910 [Deltaproteobacteria bacterium RBG_13_43_22]